MQSRTERFGVRCHQKTNRSLIFVTLLFLASAGYAHTPHHVVDDLEVSPDYSNDTTLFILVHKYLLRSNDRAGTWKPLGAGIDTPFILTDLEVSERFASDDTLFVASGGSGIFKSTDRGDTWQRFNAALTQLDIGKLMLVETDGGPILIAAGSSRGLFGSSAKTADWVRLLSDDVQITALGYISDAGESIVFAGDSQGGIWRSGPELEEWRRVAKLENTGAITAFATDPRAVGPAALLVGTEKSGMLRVSADGVVVEHLPQDWPETAAECNRHQNPSVRDIQVSGDESRVFFTTWSDALYQIGIEDDSIAVLDQGLRCSVQADERGFQTPHFRDIEFGGDESDWFLGTFEGLFRSVDQGQSWVSLETLPVNLISGIGISNAIAGQHALMVTTYGGGAYLTSDLGTTWTIMNHGLVTTRLADAEFLANTTSDSQIYALARGRLMSANRPEDPWTWTNLNELSLLDKINARIFGSIRRSNYWPMHIELSPAFAKDETILLGFRRAGIWVSKDGGESWDSDWEGPTDYVTDMKVSPDFANDKTAFAAFRGAGIYVTRDGAATWKPSNSGFEYLADHEMPISPNHLVDPPLSRAITDAKLAVSPDYVRDQTVFAGSAAGLFRSTNGGTRWQKLSLQSESQTESITGLAISPDYATDSTLAISVKGLGLFRSTNGGDTFQPLGRAATATSFDPAFIAFSPSYESDNVIYAANDWSLWLSQDRGETWQQLMRPTRYEDSRGAYSGPVWFNGEWQRESGASYSASTQTAAEQSGAAAVLNFSGTSISWYGERGPAGGMARIKIDGRDVGTVNLNAKQVANNQEVFSIEDLDSGAHEIVVEVLSGRVTVDYFDVGQ